MNQNRQTGDDCSTQVDFCVPTFKRPKAVERLLLSIAAHYPLANIYVADQNETLDREFYGQLGDKLAKVGLVKDISVEQLPYDCGLSYARNQLVLNSPSPYKLILDDVTMSFYPTAKIGVWDRGIISAWADRVNSPFYLVGSF